MAGGSIESVTLDGRTFSVAADSDSGRQLGGFTGEVQANGDSTARFIKTRMPWRLDGMAISIDDQNDDQEFLQELSDRLAFFPITVTFVDGSIYQGSGGIVDEISFSSQASTMPTSLSGPGKLTRQ